MLKPRDLQVTLPKSSGMPSSYLSDLAPDHPFHHYARHASVSLHRVSCFVELAHDDISYSINPFLKARSV